MRDHAEVVVVGAGIMGLSIAYHLARLGVRDITVVDRSYLCGGASGRNGGGIRAQWSSEANVRLMQESIRMCQDFASEFKINVWLRQGGYLFIARTAKMQQALEASTKLQRGCGLSTRMLSPREAQKIVPELALEGVLAASFNPDDGVVFPWPFVWGFAQAATKLGVEIATFTEVTGIDVRGSTIEGAEQAASSRDLLDGAAEAVAEAARRGSRERPVLQPVDARRDRGRAEPGARSRRHRPEQLACVPRSLRARAGGDLPGAGQGEGAAAVGGLLRSDAGLGADRGRHRRDRALLPSTSPMARICRCSIAGTCGGFAKGSFLRTRG